MDDEGTVDFAGQVFDPCFLGGSARAPAADAEVRKTMETEALFAKYLDKTTGGAKNNAPQLTLTDGTAGGGG